jgi:hypothetical protein
VSSLSLELSDVATLLRVQESSVLISSRTNTAQLLVAANAARWELEIWLQATTANAANPPLIGTDSGNVANRLGIPCGVTPALLGKWNVRQDGVRPMLAWYCSMIGAGLSVTFYVIETIAVS